LDGVLGAIIQSGVEPPRSKKPKNYDRMLSPLTVFPEL
jgi:hypothetical protein